MLKGDALDSTSEAWRTELADRVEELIDRKRSSVEGREKCLATYIRILTAQYSEEEINGKEEELVAALLKSIKTESSEKETNLALKGRVHSGIELLSPKHADLLPSSRNNDHHHPVRCNLRFRRDSSQPHHL